MLLLCVVSKELVPQVNQFICFLFISSPPFLYTVCSYTFACVPLTNIWKTQNQRELGGDLHFEYLRKLKRDQSLSMNKS